MFKRFSVKHDSARIGPDDAGDDANQRGFSRAIGTEQTENGAFPYFERNVVIGFFIAKRFADMLKGEDRHKRSAKLQKTAGAPGTFAFRAAGASERSGDFAMVPAR